MNDNKILFGYSNLNNHSELSIPVYCLIRERTNNYLDKKVINFSESEKTSNYVQWEKINELYYKFSKIWNAIFKINIFEFRKLIKNELVLPRLLKCGFDEIFYSIDEYLTYIESNNKEFFLFAVDNDDFLVPNLCDKIRLYLNDELNILFWNHYDYLNAQGLIKILDFRLKDELDNEWHIHTNNCVFKNVNEPLTQHWDIQHKYFPNTIYEESLDKKYLPICLTLKNTNLTAYTVPIDLYTPKLVITSEEDLLDAYQHSLELPKNFDILPDTFQKDVKNMIELYKTLL